MTDTERVLAGQCIHGHAVQSDCTTCLLTRYLAVSLGAALSALFPTKVTRK